MSSIEGVQLQIRILLLCAIKYNSEGFSKAASSLKGTIKLFVQLLQFIFKIQMSWNFNTTEGLIEDFFLFIILQNYRALDFTPSL